MKINNNKFCEEWLKQLCLEIAQRPVGSPGNQLAVKLFHEQVEKSGWEVTSIPFNAFDWSQNGAELIIGGQDFSIFPSPYSRGVEIQTELVTAGTVSELENLDATEKLLLVTDELTAEQLMPKNFAFYNPEHHQKLIRLLEEKQPAAILAATSKNPDLAGGVYPFPLIEDGDFEIPSVYLTDQVGQELTRLAGEKAELISRARRIPSHGEQLIARKSGSAPEKIIISAHIDAKIGTPGAIDNATGVIVLLLLARELADYQGKYSIELVPFNGEDYYQASGQMIYLERYQTEFEKVMLNLNIDGAGFHHGGSSFSPINLPENLSSDLKNVLADFPDIELGAPWYQGDHSIFLQQGVPAVAVTSAWFLEHMSDQDITHTPKDHPKIVNCQKVVEISQVIDSFISRIST